jgi:hypothetical protein
VVAQVAERFSEKEEVAGAHPAHGTIIILRASYSGYYVTLPRLRRQFDSARPLQEKITENGDFLFTTTI